MVPLWKSIQGSGTNLEIIRVATSPHSSLQAVSFKSFFTDYIYIVS